MKSFFSKFHLFGGGDSRFGRYYAGVIGSGGSGYPTADEARRDLRGFDEKTGSVHWMH